MASRVITQLVSDLSGDEIEDGAGETIAFAFRGTSYSIDLSSGEVAEFEKVMAPYLENAAQQGRSRRTAPGGAKSSGGDAKAIRAWAQAHGIDVPARGRIPADLREKYAAAN